MRNKLGPVLIGLGVFLVVTALLMRFFAYPRLAVAPIDQESVSTLTGPDATLFDTGSLSEITTDLTTTANTVGDVEAAQEAGDGTVVWVNTTSTRSADGVIRSRSIERVAFDAHTGYAVDCCGTFVETEEGDVREITFEGLVYKFPFGTEKQTYDFWDSTLERSLPIDYVENEEVEGLDLLKFQHTIEPTKILEMELPLSVLGLDGDDVVTVDRMYANTRTLWVEPNTGVIIKRAEEQNNTLRYDGEDRVVVTAVTTGFDDATVTANADEYGSLGRLLHLVRTVLPLTLGVLGLLLLAIGALLVVRRESGSGTD